MMTSRLSPIIIPLRATNLQVDNGVTVIQSTRARVRRRKISGIGSISRHFLRLVLARVLATAVILPRVLLCYRVRPRRSQTRTRPAITSSSAWLTLIGVSCRNAVTPLSLPTARGWYCITPSWSFIVGPFPGLGSTIGRGRRGAKRSGAQRTASGWTGTQRPWKTWLCHGRLGGSSTLLCSNSRQKMCIYNHQSTSKIERAIIVTIQSKSNFWRIE